MSSVEECDDLTKRLLHSNSQLKEVYCYPADGRPWGDLPSRQKTDALEAQARAEADAREERATERCASALGQAREAIHLRQQELDAASKTPDRYAHAYAGRLDESDLDRAWHSAAQACADSWTKALQEEVNSSIAACAKKRRDLRSCAEAIEGARLVTQSARGDLASSWDTARTVCAAIWTADLEQEAAEAGRIFAAVAESNRRSIEQRARSDEEARRAEKAALATEDAERERQQGETRRRDREAAARQAHIAQQRRRENEKWGIRPGCDPNPKLLVEVLLELKMGLRETEVRGCRFEIGGVEVDHTVEGWAIVTTAGGGLTAAIDTRSRVFADGAIIGSGSVKFLGLKRFARTDKTVAILAAFQLLE